MKRPLNEWSFYSNKNAGSKEHFYHFRSMIKQLENQIQSWLETSRRLCFWENNSRAKAISLRFICIRIINTQQKDKTLLHSYLRTPLISTLLFRFSFGGSIHIILYFEASRGAGWIQINNFCLGRWGLTHRLTRCKLLVTKFFMKRKKLKTLSSNPISKFHLDLEEYLLPIYLSLMKNPLDPS